MGGSEILVQRYLVQVSRSIKHLAARKTRRAALFFGWPSVGDAFGFWRGDFRRGRQVKIQGLRLAGRAAPCAGGDDLHHADGIGLHECQGVARRDQVRRFGNLSRIHPDFPGGSQLCRQTPGFEESREPQPAVDADTVGCPGQSGLVL